MVELENDTFTKEDDQMNIPEPGHDKGWGVTFVAFLAWSFIGVIAVMLLGISIPFIVPIALFALGTYTYGLFCDDIDD